MKTSPLSIAAVILTVLTFFVKAEDDATEKWRHPCNAPKPPCKPPKPACKPPKPSCKPPKPIDCHGPRGHRGHRGPVGERGPRGDQGPAGINGTSIEVPNSLDMIYLWGTQQIAQGPVSFNGYNTTQGYIVDNTFTNVTLVKGGLYMIYYYIRDDSTYFSTYLDGVEVPAALVNSYQNEGDQIWFQYPLFAQPGQIVFFVNEQQNLPYVNPTQPQAVGSIFFSIMIQLLATPAPVPT